MRRQTLRRQAKLFGMLVSAIVAISLTSIVTGSPARAQGNGKYFAPKDQVVAIKAASMFDAKAGTLLLAIKAAGKWVRNLSSDVKQSWSHIISGKSVSDARSFLAHELGVSTSAVDINVSGLNPNALPGDDSKITFVVKS